MKLAERAWAIYQLFEDDRIEQLGLFKLEDGKLVTPIATDTLSLFTYKTKRLDEFRSLAVVQGLVSRLKAGKGFKGINHIGFCYKVPSKDAEVRRLVDVSKRAGHPIYQEPSIDDGDWLFIGDFSNITNPLLEFIPHEGNTTDRWEEYWLPHIQFDIDTGLSPEEIKTLVREFISEPSIPYSIQIDGVTYIQRVRLGCVDGVNIYLDLATSYRDPNARKSWRQL